MVRSNYDTLTLKLHDSLDHFEKYAEKPKETTFFTHLVSGGVAIYSGVCGYIQWVCGYIQWGVAIYSGGVAIYSRGCGYIQYQKPKETTFFTHLVSGGCSQNARMPELYIMTTCRLVNYKSAKIHNPCDSMVYPRNFQIM